jgi:rhamnosyl/mannosyltransferase
VHALIAGDGPYRAVTEARARELGIIDRVHFLGGLDHETKLKLLSSIDVFTFPSTEITEAFGISQMEAMICGAPVVASDLPTGVTDVSIDEETALLAPPHDHVKFAAQISRLIKDKELAARLSENARNHILQNMTHEVVSRKTLEIFEKAIGDAAQQQKRRLA